MANIKTDILFYTDLEELEGFRASDHVWEACGRCEGEGAFPQYIHNFDGVCFKCQGNGGKYKLVSSVRSRIKRHIATEARQELERDERAAKAAARQNRYEEIKASRIAEELANAKPVPQGRVDIYGEVLSIKEQYGNYGMTYQMLVKGDGWKVWGTVPRAIVDDVKKGDRVKFLATVRGSDNDESFGFYSRPTKATIVSESN